MRFDEGADVSGQLRALLFGALAAARREVLQAPQAVLLFVPARVPSEAEHAASVTTRIAAAPVAPSEPEHAAEVMRLNTAPGEPRSGVERRDAAPSEPNCAAAVTDQVQGAALAPSEPKSMAE